MTASYSQAGIEIPPAVLTYINTERAKGCSDTDIRAEFHTTGWPSELIDVAFVRSGLSPLSTAKPGLAGPAQKAGRARHAAPELLTTMLQKVLTDNFLSAVFRGGFASIFLINGIIAWIHPQDFIQLLSSFPIAAMLGFIPQMIAFTGLHDIVLGVLILIGVWRRYVLAWAGLWLSLVTLIKLVSLI